MPKLVPSWQWAPGGRHQWVGDQGVFSGLLWYQPITLRWHSNGTRQSFWGGIVLESKYERKIFSLYQNIFWFPSSTRRCLNHLVTVLGQIWNDLQLLIGVFREAGGRSLPLNNNSSLIHQLRSLWSCFGWSWQFSMWLWSMKLLSSSISRKQNTRKWRWW